MGGPESETGRFDFEDPQHEVTLTEGFWLLEKEVTQKMWQSVMGTNPSKFKDGDDYPVENVSWNDCQEFIGKLQASAPVRWKFAFPTEAQWEYACRAGTQTPYFWGDALNGDRANCAGGNPYGTEQRGKYLGKTINVMSYEPNAWGLYDMHGNVWEWCAELS